MIVLGIESTCDETACAIVRDGRTILSNVISSQAELHEVYGGVVPELACRRHIDLMIPIIEQALSEACIGLEDVDLIAVSHAPGLVGALLIGLNCAKSLSLTLQKPFVCVNHIEAHLYAALMSHSPEAVTFPCLGAVLSGGHTSLVLIRSLGDYHLLAQTVDDAVGEAFDKVAKMLNLPYPGGPQIEKLAEDGNAVLPFKAGFVKRSPLDFSFSGLKTAVLYAVQKQPSPAPCDIAASFQKAAFDDIIEKVRSCTQTHGIKHVVFGGGVTNNQALRKEFSLKAPHLSCVWPTPSLSLDNAAMIAGLGYHKFSQTGGALMTAEPQTRLSVW